MGKIHQFPIKLGATLFRLLKGPSWQERGGGDFGDQAVEPRTSCADENPILRSAFLEPELRMLYRDWEKFTTRIVPFLRAVRGAEAPDRELVELIGELSLASKRFAELWARHDVKHRSTGPTEFYHPQVGPLDLHYTILHLPDHRQMVVTYHADPGSSSEESLRLLASLTS